MFTLAHEYVECRPILECEHFCYTPQARNLANTKKTQTFKDIPRKFSDNSLKDSQIELWFFVSPQAGAHVPCKGLVNLDPTALFNKPKLTTSSGNEIEKFDNTHFVVWHTAKKQAPKLMIFCLLALIVM